MSEDFAAAGRDEVRLTATRAQEARDNLNRELDRQKDKAKGETEGSRAKGQNPFEQQEAGLAGEEDGALFKTKYGPRSDIWDEGGYLKVRGLYKTDPRTGQKVVDTDKLRSVLMASIFDKGWKDGLAIYRNNKIDGQLTSAAQNLLAGDPVLQQLMKARGIGNVPLQRQLDPANPPCWIKGNKRAEARHCRRCEADKKEALKDEIESLKKLEKKVGGDFEAGADGKTVRQRLYEGRQDLNRQLKEMSPSPMAKAFHVAGGMLGIGGAAAAAQSEEQANPLAGSGVKPAAAPPA